MPSLKYLRDSNSLVSSGYPSSRTLPKAKKSADCCAWCEIFGRLVRLIYCRPARRRGVKILQDAMVKTFKDPEFHKEYNKLVGEEPTPVMPDEMERLVRDLPRDPEIVELFKKINAAEPLPPR